MWTRQHRPRKTGRLIVPAVAAVVLSYFGYHVYHGEFGIDSKAQLRERAVVLQAELDKVRVQRTDLEGRVRMLRDGTIDKDMLDEQARRALNLSHPDEVTIMLRSGG
ncbi:septum formation initiator family protein [Pseudaminobacter sp. 19-2017]|uniref:Septum formation initiator family protein n=1 Tax=Pseudaminobacter soli (ex Zhang et al. 2022) TaxID=2831468 RepID=A0A942DZZ6_9HYPH|nr:septum formation initiator family protein [Pseudaminobacter soli]MBS3651324.1 septum formation initiator family protein [Pseudaminobacter soli]